MPGLQRLYSFMYNMYMCTYITNAETLRKDEDKNLKGYKINNKDSIFRMS